MRPVLSAGDVHGHPDRVVRPGAAVTAADPEWLCAAVCLDVAASAAEAVGKLDEGIYELVLTESQMESDAGRGVLAYARRKDYKPATALIHKQRDGSARGDRRKSSRRMLVEAEDVTTFLSNVAGLISLRATRRSERALRQPVNN